MAPLSRPPSRDLAPLSPTRRLSREETYHLAAQARRKSSDKMVREDLRLKISHDHLLEMLLLDIAQTERELQTSPTQEQYLTLDKPRPSKTEPSKPKQTLVRYDEYGFPMDEDEEEDLGGLSLMRTESRRPVR